MQQAVSAASILGIDPGTLRLGWGVLALEGVSRRWVASGVLRPPPRLPRAERLGHLLLGLTELLDRYAPAAVAVEAAFVRRDPRAALALGEARGVALALAASRGLQIAELGPLDVKRAVVGSGRADKHQMQEMVRIRLSLTALPAEDEADALAVALAAADRLAMPMVATPERRPARAIVDPAAEMSPSRAHYAAIVAQARRSSGRRR